MGHEIIYTSARRGLRSGSTGYCIVAATDGIPPNLLNFLEKLTGYKHVFDAKSREAHANPAAFVHFHVQIGGKRQHVLGRVANAPLDNDSRSNLIAHLVAFDDRELERIGNPAQVLQQIPWETEWPADREPRSLPRDRIVLKSTPVEEPQPCKAWDKVTRDAGWGGVLATSLAGGRYRQAAVIIPKEMLLDDNDPGRLFLHLIEESLRLLPRDERWSVGFSTYYTANLPLGIRCDWQFVIAGTPLAERLRRDPKTMSIELASEMPPAPDGELIQVARDGGVHRLKKARAPVRPKADDPILPDDPSPRHSPIRAPIVVKGDDAYGLNPDDIPTHPPQRGRNNLVGKSKSSLQLWSIIAGLALVIVLLVGVIAWMVVTPAGRVNPGGDPTLRAEPSAPVMAATEVRPEAKPPATSRRESTPHTSADVPPPTATRRAPDKTGEVVEGNAPSSDKTGTLSPAVRAVPHAVDDDSSVAAATNAGNEPPEPRLPQELPFDDIRRRHHVLDLPKLNQGAGLQPSSSNSTAGFESLARIAIGSSSTMKLKVIGDRTFVGDDLLVDLSADGREWNLRRKAGGIRTLPFFGTFRLVDNDLYFEWNTEQTPKAPDLRLRDCLLRLTVENPHDEVVCALRSPARIKPIELTTALFNRDLAMELKDVEAIEASELIMIELLWDGLESLPAGARFQPVPVGILTDTSPEQTCLKLLDDEASEAPAAVVAAEFSRDGSHRLLKLSKFARREILSIDDGNLLVKWNIDTTTLGQFECNVDFLSRFNDYVKANARQLNESKESAQDRITKLDDELDKTRKKLKTAKDKEAENLRNQEIEKEQRIDSLETWISDLDEAIEVNAARVEWAKGIDKAFTSLNSNVRLHFRMYRVFPEVPGDDVAVLLETEGFYDVPQVMTRPAPATAGPQSEPVAK